MISTLARGLSAQCPGRAKVLLFLTNVKSGICGMFESKARLWQGNEWRYVSTQVLNKSRLYKLELIGPNAGQILISCHLAIVMISGYWTFSRGRVIFKEMQTRKHLLTFKRIDINSSSHCTDHYKSSCWRNGHIF